MTSRFGICWGLIGEKKFGLCKMPVLWVVSGEELFRWVSPASPLTLQMMVMFCLGTGTNEVFSGFTHGRLIKTISALLSLSGSCSWRILLLLKSM